MPSVRMVVRAGGSSGRLPLLLLVFAGGLACGCGQTKYANSQAAGFTDYSAPKLNAALPQAVQAEGIRLTQQYVADMNHKDYTAASKMFAGGVQNQWTPQQIASGMTKGGYWMLAGSSDWHYDQVEGLGHGKKMVVHAHFNGPDHNLYKSNFTFVNTDGAWKIDTILNPVQKNKPQLVSVDMNAPKH